MLYDPDRDFLFLKTTKTAGTSLEYALGPSLSARSLLTPIIDRGYNATWARTTWTSPRSVLRGLRELEGEGNPHRNPLARESFTLRRALWLDLLDGRGPRRLAFSPVFSREHAHMTAAEVRDRLGEERFARATRLAVVRHPYQQAVSMWFHVRATDPRYVDTPFAAWLEANPHVLNWNRTIMSIDGRCVVDRVVRYEDLPDALVPHLRAVGVDPWDVLHRLRGASLNAGSRPRTGTSPREVIDAASRRLIDEVCAFEFDDLGYDRRMW